MAPNKQRPVQTRNRSTLSCEMCRGRKARCDRKHPCTNCVRWEVEKCVYTTQSSSSKKGDDDIAHNEVLSSFSAPKAAALSHRRLVPLRRSLTTTFKQINCPRTPIQPAAAIENSRSSAISRVNVWRTTPLASIFIGVSSSANMTNDDEMGPGPERAQRPTTSEESLFPGMEGTMDPIRGAFYKNRYVGQSHWMYAWPLYPPALIIVGTEMMAKQEAWRLFQECKELARVIKSQQPPSPVVLGCSDVGYHLPSKDLANSFLNVYLETFETVYCVFVVPNFRREFDAIWSHATDDEAPLPPPRREILIQAQLCMAIGATASTEGSSLRPHITQWLSEGCAWAAHASQKQKLSPAGLQTLCLLHIAKQTCAIEADLAWIPAGSLVRTAMCMGSHIDPSMLPSMPAAEVELRRRLWTTVLELMLESSISAGAPPLLSVDDVDSCLPSNCNDSDLVANSMVDRPQVVPSVARPSNDFTDTSAQIALAKSFKTRLRIVRSVNQPNVAIATSYKDLIKLSAGVDAACDQLRSDLARPGATSFQRKYCLMALERYQFVIHISYLSLAYHKGPGVAAEYSLSRQVCVDTALRMMYTCLTSTSEIFKESPLSTFMASSTDTCPLGHAAATTAGRSRRSEEYFSAIVQRGGGHLRSIPLQCILVLALELITRTSSRTKDSSVSTAAPSHSNENNMRRSSNVAVLRAPLSHPPGAIGQFDSLRDMELHLMLRVGSEWTVRRIAEAGDVCCKDHAFIALQLAIAEEQIATRSRGSKEDLVVSNTESAAVDGIDSGDCRVEDDMAPRQRYRAAFQQCKDLMTGRLSRIGTVTTCVDTHMPSHSTGEGSYRVRAREHSNQRMAGAPLGPDLDLELDRTSDFGSRPPDVSGPFPTRDDPIPTEGPDLSFSWQSGPSNDMGCGGDNFNGFRMGDASDDLDWDGVMDFAAF